MPPNMLCWQKPLRLGKDGRYFAGFTRWTSFAVRTNPTKSWISADSRVEFMRFENVDDNPDVQELEISWFAANEKALAVPFPGHPEVSACQEPSDREAAGRAALLRHAHGVGQPVLERERRPGRDLDAAAPPAAQGRRRAAAASALALPDVRRGRQHRRQRPLRALHPQPRRPLTRATARPTPAFHRRPIYLVPGRFQAGADQPVWFDEPRLFMDHDGVSLGKPGHATGRLDLALYSSFTVRQGKAVLWYPDRKFFLLGRVIGDEWFAPPSPGSLENP